MGCSKSSSKRVVCSNTILPQETRKTLNRQPNFTPKIVGKRRRTTTKKTKINRETQVLNYTLDEMDLLDIFRTFHPNAEEHTFFSRTHRTFSRTLD